MRRRSAAEPVGEVDLSHQKYCSVLHSLNADIAITYDLDLE